jgi:hypothetical protein
MLRFIPSAVAAGIDSAFSGKKAKLAPAYARSVQRALIAYVSPKRKGRRRRR